MKELLKIHLEIKIVSLNNNRLTQFLERSETQEFQLNYLYIELYM